MPTAAYLVMTNVPSTTWLGTLHLNHQTLGRGDEADLRIPADFAYVSRRHAEVWADEHGRWILDLDSTSGTRVNSVPLTPNQPFRLMLGDHIWLGAAELDLVTDADLSRRRPYPNSEDPNVPSEPKGSTVRYGAKPTGSVTFTHASTHLFAQLTPTEVDIVLWMSRGFTDPDEVAGTLFRSPNTIRTHLTNIFSKLNVHSRDQLLACLLRRITSASPTSR